jgi:hypothetical protein
MLRTLVACEQSLIIGLELRRFADGYWEIDGLVSESVTGIYSSRVPLCSGKKEIGQANVAVLQGVLMEQLRSLVFLTGDAEVL